ncbi:response regulator [Dyadobacter psychrotolerans]|uniref:Response regulator transcription factor n=1 Tax=Dyadobacter psychrotolerans TaxID=2541721 RepID=A0A4R5E0F8_9BACT|nr:response regulator transcription factor [Dyadobacter psychrotolerans]TDE17235.1 response regulator transcription factor [Dyadobacter psychrotolerans]
MPVRVLIVDDHQIILDSLSLLISTIPQVEIVGKLNESRSVADFLEVYPVDILITDFTMPYLTGIDLTLQLRPLYPKLKILMLTVSEDAETIRQAFQAGITGYVMKKASRAELETALMTVASGTKYFSEAVMKELLNPNDGSLSTEVLPSEPVAVTSRELEIIKLIAQEFSTSEIAEKLFISFGTVETHRHNILRKLNVKNSIGITKYAIRYKLI